jgi:hypothetical protein
LKIFILKALKVFNIFKNKAHYWERKFESCEIISPFKKKLNILGLGGSIPTKGTIEAEVVVITSFKEFENINVKGKIVVYDNGPWIRYNTSFR